MGKIHCKPCRKLLGNIEGSVHKDITYLCPSCEKKRVALELRFNTPDKDYDFMDMFNGIFKGKP